MLSLICMLMNCVVRLKFIEVSSLSNPMEARFCIAPKNCIQKDDVLAYARPKPLLRSLALNWNLDKVQ